MSAPPIGMIIRTPKTSEIAMISGNSQRRVRDAAPERSAMPIGDRQQREVDDVLALVGDGPLRQDLLQFARGHQASGEGQRAEDDLQREHAHHEPRHGRRAEIELGGADQRHAQRAEGVAERGPLRHRGHLHAAQRHADDGCPAPGRWRSTGSRRCRDRAACRRSPAPCRARRPDAAPRRGRRAHPFQARG